MCESSHSAPRRVKRKSPSKIDPIPGSDYLSDLSPKDRPWDTHRAGSDQVAAIYGRGGDEWERYSERIGDCSGYLSFAWTLPNADGETRLKLVGAHFCKVRTCQICQWRRALMHQARFLERFPSILAQHPGRWLFLTLTVKNCEISELRRTIQHMNKSWAKLVKWAGFPALGWIKVLEVTRGADGSAHPHFHILLLVPGGYFGGKSYIKQDAWTEMWQKAAKLDYQPIVDIRAVKQGGERDAAAEALKYTVKPADLVTDAEWLYEYSRQVHRARFIDTGGVLRGILADEYEGEDMINISEDGSDEEAIDEDAALVFRWDKPVKRYRKHQPNSE